MKACCIFLALCFSILTGRAECDIDHSRHHHGHGQHDHNHRSINSQFIKRTINFRLFLRWFLMEHLMALSSRVS